MEHKIRWKNVDWIHVAQDRNQQRNELSDSTRHLTGWETISLSRRTAPCGVSTFRKMEAHLFSIQQCGAYYTKTYEEWRYNTTHSYPRPSIEETGLALWPDRRLLNGMGGHQSRSADGSCRQPVSRCWLNCSDTCSECSCLANRVPPGGAGPRAKQYVPPNPGKIVQIKPNSTPAICMFNYAI
jgi:hypothetical protein